MKRRYVFDRSEILQVHPVFGRRVIIRADGHEQLVCIGEVSDNLIIIDQWSCMGDKDGSIQVLNPDTLETKARISFDLDAFSLIGFDGNSRFVFCKTIAGKITWYA